MKKTNDRTTASLEMFNYYTKSYLQTECHSISSQQICRENSFLGWAWFLQCLAVLSAQKLLCSSVGELSECVPCGLQASATADLPNPSPNSEMLYEFFFSGLFWLLSIIKLWLFKIKLSNFCLYCQIYKHFLVTFLTTRQVLEFKS